MVRRRVPLRDPDRQPGRLLRHHSIIRTASIERLSAHLPLVIEVVDTQEHLDAVLADVERMMSGGLITLEKVRVIRYTEG